ncbi:MAG: hypothetical protein GWO24_23940, partial [Akkermansiaceae bacterium]|nr:hypothetical protein [Akkermansiaceae bacterium]
MWDLGAGAPWTLLGATGVHPNGTNNGDEHWAIRRWTAPDDLGETEVRVDWFVAAQNLGGQGVTAQLHLNGVLEGSHAIAGND